MWERLVLHGVWLLDVAQYQLNSKRYSTAKKPLNTFNIYKQRNNQLLLSHLIAFYETNTPTRHRVTCGSKPGVGRIFFPFLFRIVCP